MISKISAKNKDRVCAVIVGYFPDITELLKVLHSIRLQVDGVVMVDNTTDKGVASQVEEATKELTNCLISLGRNIGVSAAHNMGITWARNHHFTHVLLLDQDSIPSIDMVEHLINALDSIQNNKEKVAAVGPRYIDPRSGHESFFVRFGRLKIKHVWCSDAQQNILPVDLLISSGALIPLKTIGDVGDMEDDLFIDHIDNEWFLRAKSKGFQAFGVCNAIMKHSLGDGSIRVWLGRWRYVPRHNPLRHYYTFRNSFLLYRRKYVPIQFVINDLVRLMYMFVFYSLITPPRFRHTVMMLRGLQHGILGKTGSYDE